MKVPVVLFNYITLYLTNKSKPIYKKKNGVEINLFRGALHNSESLNTGLLLHYLKSLIYDNVYK